MATEVLKLTAEIVISHASISELSPQELVAEIKEVYNVLTGMYGHHVHEAVIKAFRDSAGAVIQSAVSMHFVDGQANS